MAQAQELKIAFTARQMTKEKYVKKLNDLHDKGSLFLSGQASFVVPAIFTKRNRHLSQLPQLMTDACFLGNDSIRLPVPTPDGIRGGNCPGIVL